MTAREKITALIYEMVQPKFDFSSGSIDIFDCDIAETAVELFLEGLGVPKEIFDTEIGSEEIE